ncbi:MAG: hypothetical protein M1831_002505 [Alyxoria varia]|nr:MAG: hypothetical protein M1831_002505 [Alyxoria varia]
MFAARDQENVYHSRQPVGATKPLGQSQPPKTPGTTGLKDNLNNRLTGKNAIKRDENVPLKGKAGDGDKQAFITPIAPRERAPLGNKTTNVKANAFQTPARLPTQAKAPEKTQLKTQNLQQRTSARKPKLKIHQQPSPAGLEAPVKTTTSVSPEEDDDVEDDVPDIEYCPPKITELPDVPDNEYSWGPDKTFPQFEGDNMLRGAGMHYYDKMFPIGEDGMRAPERERKKEDDAWEKEMEDKLTRRAARAGEFGFNPLEEAGMKQEAKATAKRSTSTKQSSKQDTGRTPSTVSSKQAAAALSNPRPKASKAGGSTFAAPTTASKAKKPAQVPASKAVKGGTPGTAASKTTIGYARGRQVSSSMKNSQQAPGQTQKRVASGQGKANQIQDDFRNFEAQEEETARLLHELLVQETPHEDVPDVKDVFGGFPGDDRGSNLDDLFAEQDRQEFELELPSMD